MERSYGRRDKVIYTRITLLMFVPLPKNKKGGGGGGGGGYTLLREGLLRGRFLRQDM